jgi:hypothetical protein
MLKRARGAHLDLTCHNPETLANVCESVSGDEWDQEPPLHPSIVEK